MKDEVTHWSGLLFIGIGIGILTGLSVSPVVSIVITSMVSLAAAVAGGISGVNIQTSEQQDEDQNRLHLQWKNIKPWPIALLIFGIIFGSWGGIYIRTHNFLGLSIDNKVKQLEELEKELGFEKKDIIQLIFNKEIQTIDLRNRLKIDRTYLKDEFKKWTEMGLEEKEVAKHFFDILYPKKDLKKDTFPKIPQNDDNNLNNPNGLLNSKVETDECKHLRGVEAIELKSLINSMDNECLKELSKRIEKTKDLEEVVKKLCPDPGK